MKGFLHLPEGIIPIILSYNDYFEQRQCCTAHSSLYPLWKSHFHRVTISEDTFNERIAEFTGESSNFSDQVKDYYHQVSIDYDGAVRIHELSLESQGPEKLTSFHQIRSVRSLTCTVDLFLHFFRNQLNRIHTLRLTDWDAPVILSEESIQTCFDVLRDRFRDLHEITISGYDFPSLPAFPKLKNLSCMKLAIPGLKNFPNLQSDYPKSLQSVVLSSCEQLSDVSPLRFIPNVSLHRCPNIKDISSLKKNFKLEIVSCQGITDYTTCGSESKYLRFIHLSTSAKFDITVFKEAKQIIVLGAPTNIIVHPLPEKVQRLETSHPMTTLPPSFHQLYSLKLEGIIGLNTLEGCGHIPILHLMGLDDLTSLNGLGAGNRIVSISHCRHIQNFSAVQNVPQVSISFCNSFSTGNDVRGVKKLSIVSCPRFTDVIDLGEVEEFLFLGCYQIANIYAIRNIPCIHIDCHSVSLLRQLGGENQKKIVIFLEGVYFESNIEEILELFHESYHLTKFSNKAFFIRKA